MLTIYDEIQQLRVELAACILTPRERATAQAELAKLLAEQAAIDRQFDGMIAAKEPPE
jgi:thermostable 8-oxoguanine DNA glycosylase